MKNLTPAQPPARGRTHTDGQIGNSDDGRDAPGSVFDARGAKQLADGRHMVVSGCPGLRLTGTKSGQTWIYRYRSPTDGRIRQVRLGAWPRMALSKAIAAWGEARSRRDEGVDLAQERRQQRRATDASKKGIDPKNLSVRRLVDSYVQQELRGRRKDRGTNEVQRMFNTMLDAIAEQPAAQITRTKAYALIESYRDIPVQASKLKGELRAAWSFGLDSGLLPEECSNWWGEVYRSKLRSKGKRIEGQHIGPVKRCLGEEELGSLIRWLPNFSRLVEDVLLLYIWTMARGAEICAMEGKEIGKEADGLWWTVPKAKTKNARHPRANDFRVPLVGRARTVVERRLDLHGSGYLFPSQGRAGHVEQKTVQTAVHFHQPYSHTRPEEMRPRLPITRWAPHDLRRTSHSLLRSLDCPLDVAEAMLGHMLSVYNRHKYDPQQRLWAARLNDCLEGLAGRGGDRPSG